MSDREIAEFPVKVTSSFREGFIALEHTIQQNVIGAGPNAFSVDEASAERIVAFGIIVLELMYPDSFLPFQLENISTGASCIGCAQCIAMGFCVVFHPEIVSLSYRKSAEAYHLSGRIVVGVHIVGVVVEQHQLRNSVSVDVCDGMRSAAPCQKSMIGLDGCLVSGRSSGRCRC